MIKNTIGQHTSRVVYYSETVDASIPTEDTGVPNTESGKLNHSKQAVIYEKFAKIWYLPKYNYYYHGALINYS